MLRRTVRRDAKRQTQLFQNSGRFLAATREKNKMAHRMGLEHTEW